MLFSRLQTFFQINSFEIVFQKNNRVANILDPDKALRFVGPDLGPTCFQRLSAGASSRLGVKLLNVLTYQEQMKLLKIDQALTLFVLH